MTIRELVRARMHLQGLELPVFKTPAEMVRFFGAVQAQDFFGSLWAVGQRVKNATEASVESALNDGSIVRSWPMRGTIHLTAPEDLRWMLDLLAERAIAKSVTYQRDTGLTKKDFIKSRSIFEKEMQGKKILERTDVYKMLERHGIATKNTRGLHIIGQMAREKVICFGPRKGKQATFVLLDEWIPKTKELSKDEALAELTARYFGSHGPATAHDFAWWAGITVTEALRGIDMAQMKRSDRYFFTAQPVVSRKLSVRLLPAYDEFLVAYKDRDDMRVIFSPSIIVNGVVVGEWKRAAIKIKLYEKIPMQAKAALKKEVKRYADFMRT